MEPLTFYFDRNVGKRLPEALRLLGLPVIHHHTLRKDLGMKSVKKNQQLFTPGEQDDVWLKFVGERRWFVFSQDRKFHKAGYENEMSAIKQFDVGCFYLWGADAPVIQKAQCFLRAYDNIIRVAQTRKRPFIYDVLKNGKLLEIPIS